MAIAEPPPTFEEETPKSYSRREKVEPIRRPVNPPPAAQWRSVKSLRAPQIVWVDALEIERRPQSALDALRVKAKASIGDGLTAVRILRRGALWSASVASAGVCLLYAAVYFVIPSLVAAAFGAFAVSGVVFVGSLYAHGMLTDEALISARSAVLAIFVLICMIAISLFAAVEAMLR